MKKVVTGIVYISMREEQPEYWWIPRGTEIRGEGNLNRENLENYMLMFEQDIYGSVQSTDINVKVKERSGDSSSSGLDVVSGTDYEHITIEYNCGCVDVGGNGDCGDWQCDTESFWVKVEDGETPGGGEESPTEEGFGGGGGSTGGGTGGGNYGNNNEISDNPEVKYPEGSDYAEKYPKFTEYLKNQLPTLKDNATIINAIEKYTSLTKDEIASDLKWGEGPTIKIVQLDNFEECLSCDSDTYGLYLEDSNPNDLYIDTDLVNDLENTTLGSQLADAFSFLVGVTILHEYVHFGDSIDGVDYPGEEGSLFEQDVYGQTVWRENAEIILNR